MKSVKMFGKSVPLITIIIVSVLSIGVFAAVIASYGTLDSTATVAQAVFLNNAAYTVTQTESVTATQGGTAVGDPHELKNLANRWIIVELSLALDVDADDDMQAYFEYMLLPDISSGATVGDEDDIHFFFEPILWSAFVDTSFDFSISGASSRTPHVNLWLRKAGEDPVQLTTYNGGSPSVTVSGNRATYAKADFVTIFGGDVQTEYEDWSVREVRIQSGNPSTDPNVAGDIQLAWVSDIKVGTASVTEIELPEQDYANVPGRLVHFRIAYEFNADITPGAYDTMVGVVPIGTIGRSGVTIGGIVYP